MKNRILCLLLVALAATSQFTFSAVKGVVRLARWAVPVRCEGVPNLHKISDNLYRSAQPSAQGMTNLVAMGIKTVINLRDNHSDSDEIGNLPLNMRRIEIFTGNMKKSYVEEFMSIIDNTNALPALVHCQHGADRTGTMCAMYRILRQGWSAEDAIDEMKNGGFGFHSFWVNLPRFIRNYSKVANLMGSIRVGTFNIRTGRGDKGTPNAWDRRKADLVAFIRGMNLDAMGLQEVHPWQAEYIRKNLPEFHMVGDHRNADRRTGESSCVIYRHDRFIAEKTGTFWLSETPEVPGSRSWNAECTRICTWVHLRDKRTGKVFCFVNTHLDHISPLARLKGMALIMRRMSEFAPNGMSVVFTGDHNCHEVAEPAKLASKYLKNALHCSKSSPEGAWRTLNLWRWNENYVSTKDALLMPMEKRNKVYSGRIDYIYVSDGVTVRAYETRSDVRPGTKLYPSDHFPVIAEIDIPTKRK